MAKFKLVEEDVHKCDVCLFGYLHKLENGKYQCNECKKIFERVE